MMIVRRSIHIPKPGKGQEAVAFIKESSGKTPWPETTRVYTSRIGPTFGTIAIEIELESLAEWEKLEAEFKASPEGAAFYEKWGQLTEHGTGHVEVWDLQA
jgi:hypothetical protein